MHFIAGSRLLLGPENTIERLSAFTTQLRKHLPPVDTVDTILRTKNEATGTFSLSVGTTFTGVEWDIACEGGTVRNSRGTITTMFDQKEKSVKIEDRTDGVPTEIRAWGEALAKGTRNEKQIPEEALADLELVECMLRSGEGDGQPMECILQI